MPRIELFARQRAQGWDAWGLEIHSDVELAGDRFVEARDRVPSAVAAGS
jgi:N6-adenosine-specific RNA methylase IME4